MRGFGAVLRGRQAGKTHALIDIMQRNPNAALVVHSFEAKHRLVLAHQLDEDRVFTYEQIMARKAFHGLVHLNPILIDNAEIFLERILDDAGMCPDASVIIAATGVNL